MHSCCTCNVWVAYRCFITLYCCGAGADERRTVAHENMQKELSLQWTTLCDTHAAMISNRMPLCSTNSFTVPHPASFALLLAAPLCSP